MRSKASALRCTRCASCGNSSVRRAVFSIARAAFVRLESIAAERAARVRDKTSISARVFLTARRLSSSIKALNFSLVRLRLVSKAVIAESSRVISEGPVLITGYFSPVCAFSAGESRLPPVNSTKARPVNPYVWSMATVSVLTGVPRSRASVNCTCSTFPGASAICCTWPTSTPRYRTDALRLSPATDSFM